jgi:Tol biopolymer transport system component
VQLSYTIGVDFRADSGELILAGYSALQAKLQQGIEAAKKGDKLTAQKLLRQVTGGDPNNEVAWMWLASVSETLQERRACLEQTLRINPGNTRAQQALQQLSDVTGVPIRAQSGRAIPSPRRPSGQAAQAAIRKAREGNLNPGYLIVGVLALLALVSAVIFSSIANSQPPPPNEATLQARVALLSTATPSPTVNPIDYTATPFFGVIVTPANLATLPPSFTPTFTPTATITPPATQTPFPIANFSLLYTSLSGTDGQAALFSGQGNGTGELEIGAGSLGFADAVYSPDGQNIAFVRVVGGAPAAEGEETAASGSPELFIAPADNLEAARQITTIGGSKLEHPTFGPDGIQIVFVSNIDGNDDLWYITEDGNNLRKLTTNPGIDKDPAWSPNGDVILYASDQANRVAVTQESEGTAPDPGLTEIFSITPDGTTIVQLTEAGGSSFSPSWSPTGERVVFVSDRNGDGDIFMMDSNGSQAVLLSVDDAGAEDRNPVFTPNTESVMFLSNREDDTFQLYTVDLETSVVTRLTDSARDIDSLVFKPVPLAVFAGSS